MTKPSIFVTSSLGLRVSCMRAISDPARLSCTEVPRNPRLLRISPTFMDKTRVLLSPPFMPSFVDSSRFLVVLGRLSVSPLSVEMSCIFCALAYPCSRLLFDCVIYVSILGLYLISPAVDVMWLF